MKKTLCKISSVGQEFEWYLVVNENNNLILSQVNEDPNFNGDNACLVYNYNGESMNELFDILANTEHPKNVNKDSEAGVYMLLSGAMFKCFKDLLEKGLKIPQHQMPNIPNNNGPQMHNIVQVFNPHNQHHHNQHNNPSVLMDENTLFYGNEYYQEYENSDFIITQRDRHNNSPIKDYSKHVGETTYYYS